MNSDKKIERIREILDSAEPIGTIEGPTHVGPQICDFTAAGKLHIREMFNRGVLRNRLEDCTIVIKIEDHKAQVSVRHDGITVNEFKPVDPDFSTTNFEFTGVSLPIMLEW